jgi:hypothetical protein
MIRYSDLTHEELIVLKEEDIDRYIDIEIAHEGIMPVACPEVPTVAEEGIVQSEIAYEVGGLLFKNEEDAIKVSMMAQVKSSYDYSSGGYDYMWLDPVFERSVAKKMFYKQSDVVRIKDILQKNAAKRKDYDNQKTKYDKYLKNTGQIRESVYSLYHDALRLEEEYRGAEKILAKYKDLSGGDEAIATSFFRNTYKERPDILKRFGAEFKEVVSDGKGNSDQQ